MADFSMKKYLPSSGSYACSVVRCGTDVTNKSNRDQSGFTLILIQVVQATFPPVATYTHNQKDDTSTSSTS